MRTVTLAEFRAELKAQGVPIEHAAFLCPMCETIQSATSLIHAGAGPDFDAVEKYLAFSCVGRFTGAPSPSEAKRDRPGKGCNWTLGGLLGLHRLEVITEDGERHPRFEVATPDAARALMSTHAGED